jgi:diaminopimelate decarboxylase
MSWNDEALTPVLRAIARDFGTPCYVYFMDEVRGRVEHVRSLFGNRFQISYAVKSNPNPGVLRRLRAVVDGLDVSSSGEVVRAIQAGWKPERISFTGPGKTAAELETAVAVGVGDIIVESVAEAELLNRIVQLAGKKQRIIARIAPTRVPKGFGLNMSGKPSPFGIDEEDIEPALQALKAMSCLDLRGLHIYSGTQCLNAEAIIENYRIFIAIFRHVCYRFALRPDKLIFGSGIGIPYYESDHPVDLEMVAKETNAAVDGLLGEHLFSGTQLVLEMGRYLIGEAGVYVTQVVRKKHSRGVDICICDGGMNHHLGAAGHLGTLIQRNYRMMKITAGHEGPEQTYTLVGPLCTTIDTLGRQVKFSGLEAGDLVAIRSSGAYGVTASPIHFISHEPPKEIIVESDGSQQLIENSSPFGNAAQQGPERQ